MTDEPERIWIDDERPDGGNVHVFTDLEPLARKYAVEYLRADAALALVAEAYEVAAENCDVVTQDHIGDIVRGIGDEIRAKTPSDALAAREARDKRVRNEALREASHLVDQKYIALGRYGLRDAILALIEGDQTDE